MNGITILSSNPPKPPPSKIIDYDDHHTIGFNHEILRPHMIKPIKSVRAAQKPRLKAAGPAAAATTNSVAQVLQRTYMGECSGLPGAGANGETVTLVDDTSSLLPKQLMPSGNRYPNQYQRVQPQQQPQHQQQHHQQHQQQNAVRYINNAADQGDYYKQEEVPRYLLAGGDPQQRELAPPVKEEEEDDDEEYESDMKPLHVRYRDYTYFITVSTVQHRTGY